MVMKQLIDYANQFNLSVYFNGPLLIRGLREKRYKSVNNTFTTVVLNQSDTCKPTVRG